MPTAERKDALQVTTVRLPRGLYSDAARIAKEEDGSFNDLVVESLREHIRMRREARLDAEFDGMKSDAKFKQESERVLDDFERSDWETLRDDA